MNAWTQDIADVLIITHKDVEQPARVAGYVDSLDNTTPLYVNLRVSDGLRWGERKVKIQPIQIIRADPEWEQRRHDQWEVDLKAHCDARWAKMTPDGWQPCSVDDPNAREDLNALVMSSKWDQDRKRYVIQGERKEAQ